MIKITRSVTETPFIVDIGDGMTISIISILRSDFKRQLIKGMIKNTGYIDEYEFRDKHRTINKKLLAEMLADFREGAEFARREAFLETCVIDWKIPELDFSIANLKEVFLAPENCHQIDDLIQISSQEELFWKQYESEAKDEIKKP